MTRQARSLVLAQQTGWVEREKKVEPRIKEHRGWQNTCKTRNTCLYVYTHVLYVYIHVYIYTHICSNNSNNYNNRSDNNNNNNNEYEQLVMYRVYVYNESSLRLFFQVVFLYFVSSFPYCISFSFYA